jgi:PST family polysaccharide transporter
MSKKNIEDSMNLSEKTKKGIIWTALFDGVQFIIRFAGSIVLARILFPEDFGLMGIASIVIQFARRLSNFGFAMVLVQRKKIQKEHYDTVFVTNLCLMGVLTIILFFAAPSISDFFENKMVKDVLMVLCIDFILNACISVPTAMLRRNMEFKKLELARTIAKAVEIFSPIIMALSGLGVWSLVFGYLLSHFALLLSLLYFTKWLPKFKFNLWALKEVFAFGVWVYIDGYISYGIKKVDFFTVGKFLGASELGLYERAFNLMSLARHQIGLKVNTVLFSSYSRIQDEQERMIRMLLKVVTYFSIIIYPLMTWMIFAAPSMITLLYGPKWTGVIYPLQIMCLAGIFDTLSLIIGPLLLAKGLVAQRTRRKFIYFIIFGICVMIGVRWGIGGVAWGTTVASFLQLVLMLKLSTNYLPLSIGTFIKAQKSALLYSCLLALSLIGLHWFTQPYFSETSLMALISTTIATVTVLTVLHLILRMKDIDGILKELMADLKKLFTERSLVGGTKVKVNQ